MVSGVGFGGRGQKFRIDKVQGCKIDWVQGTEVQRKFGVFDLRLD